MTVFNKNRGFTLIELLVVIAIIGILSSVVLASLNSARTKSRDARRIGDVKQLQLALEMYYDSNSEYPTSTAALVTGNFIPVAPLDPQTGSGYTYDSVSGQASYVLRATLETDHSVLGGDVDGDIVGDDATVDCGADPEVSGAYYYCIQP